MNYQPYSPLPVSKQIEPWYTSTHLSVQLIGADFTCYSAANPSLSSVRAKYYRIRAVTHYCEDICSHTVSLEKHNNEAQKNDDCHQDMGLGYFSYSLAYYTMLYTTGQRCKSLFLFSLFPKKCRKHIRFYSSSYYYSVQKPD